MKRLILLISLLVAMIIPGNVLAFDPPVQDTSENATDVILWLSDNITIESISGNLALTIEGLNDAVNISTVSIREEIASQVQGFIVFILLLFIIILGFWRFDRVMLLIGGLGLMLYGFSLWNAIQWLSIIAFVGGFYIFIKAFMVSK
jgi:hypothetical protein